MSRMLPLALAACALAAASFTPTAIQAQTPPAPAKGTAKAPAKGAAADSLAFPRQFVKWVFAKQGDSAFAHAGPQLRESMQSPEGVSAMATRIQSRFGDVQGTDAEVQFDDGDLKVYIAVMRFANAPEPGAWMVGYSPSTKVVERAGFTSLTNVKNRYPQAKLP